ncbi:putative transcription factor & chromatin remodeling CW-Zn family [Medicago truncatula]|uniref:Putative transcription factor & chromatin remodeling CW-Zn family n=1 Tax=Medicago truncatula TaxID=3880 RepID=A0A396JSA1_MEDTR|nr:putative transcription factor & chromatin remodeling CW-Zn family [Medicago truncatula]
MSASKTPSSSSKRPAMTQGSVDIYAAQCKLCMKWRVIDTQEEFEEIRHKIIRDPFDCSKKANRSCDDPADIEYDSSRTWVIDKPNIPKTPQGKKLRTRNEIAAYLKDHPQPSGVSAADFDFSSPKIMQDTIPEFIEQQKDSANKKAKIAKDEV